MEKRRVVITGMGALSALGCGIEPLWDGLLNGKSGIAPITQFDPSVITSRIAGEVTNFDPLAFFPKTEAKKMDRFTQMAVISANEALENSGLDLDTVDRDRVGCIMGTGIGGINELESQKELLMKKGANRVSPFLVPKMMPNAISGVISIRLGLRGANFVTSSACASSAHALGMAMRSIQYGESDIMVSGGSESVITDLAMGGFCSLKALSTRNDEPTKASRPFDKNRDGFVIGEGSAVLILEDYEMAVKRGATIYAELLGYGTTGDAHHITAPKEDGVGPARAIDIALKDAGINHDQVDYVNAHGTSTPYNDAIETTALKRAFGDHAHKLAISSSKSMVGHLLGGAAAIEMAAVAMSLKHGVVHPTINQEEPDPECDLDYVPNTAREMKVQYAISNSLGFGGHNVCLVAGSV